MSFEHTKLRYNRVPFHAAEGEHILHQVEQHWEAMRSSGPVPDRLAMTPEPLDQALTHCFVLERVSPTIARFRVAGQKITEIMGMDPRGMPLSAVFTADGREHLGPLLQNVCEGPEIVEIPVSSPRGLTRSALRGRVLLLPLKDRDGQVTRIFGAIVLDGAPGRRALRFDLDRAVPLRCKRLTPTIRTISEVAPQPTPAPVEAPARMPHPSGIVAKAARQAPLPAGKARPYLQLVVDNT